MFVSSLSLSLLSEKNKKVAWDKDLKNLWFAWRWFDGSYGEINPPSQEVKKNKKRGNKKKRGKRYIFFPFLSLSLFLFFLSQKTTEWTITLTTT